MDQALEGIWAALDRVLPALDEPWRQIIGLGVPALLLSVLLAYVILLLVRLARLVFKPNDKRPRLFVRPLSIVPPRYDAQLANANFRIFEFEIVNFGRSPAILKLEPLVIAYQHEEGLKQSLAEVHLIPAMSEIIAPKKSLKCSEQVNLGDARDMKAFSGKVREKRSGRLFVRVTYEGTSHPLSTYEATVSFNEGLGQLKTVGEGVDRRNRFPWLSRLAWEIARPFRRQP